MKIEDVEKMWEEDCEIDSVDLAGSALNIPKLHNKYFKIYNAIRLKILSLKDKQTDLIKIKNEYYSGKLSKEELDEYGWEPFLFTLKSDINTYLEADKDLIKLLEKKVYHEECVSVIESIMNELKQRTWQLRSFIDYEKFIGGN